MSNCPIGKPLDDCLCEFSKEGLCDWPYRNNYDLGQIRYTTELIGIIAEQEDRTNGG